MASKEMVDEQPSTSAESEKPPFPHGIWFILSNEFCERFNFYGGRTILTLYLVDKLRFTEDDAMVTYHGSYALIYLMSLFGGIVADNILGKYHTIWTGSVIYAIGCFLLAFSAIPNTAGAVALCFIALGLIAVGSGGIKPCVSSFGGEQYKVPEQSHQLASFFQLFYFMINFGSLLSTIITPIARDKVHCFDQADCYFLGFFIPAVLMVCAIALFIAGTPLYTIKKTDGSSMIDTFRTIWDAIVGKIKYDKTKGPKDNWLLYAHPKQDYVAIRNAKILLELCILYLPVPFFWTLFDQQSSRWTIQSTHLDNEIGSYRISPGHMHVLNPLLILILIPVFNVVFYPLLAKVGINTPLRKLIMGGCLAGVAFIASFILELYLIKALPTVPGPTQAHFRIYNGMPCAYDVEIKSGIPDFEVIEGFDVLEMDEKLDFDNLKEKMQFAYVMFPAEASSDESINPRCNIFNGTLEIIPGEVTGYFIKSEESTTKLVQFDDSPSRDTIGRVIVRVLSSFERYHSVQLKEGSADVLKNVTDLVRGTAIPIGTYQLTVDNSDIITCNDTQNFSLRGGGVYVILLDELKTNDYKCVIYVITEPNSINVLWQVPQFTLLTMGEVMFSITGLEFSFTQAPASMKSILAAIWLITVAIGNLIVVFFAKLRLFEEQLWEYLMFAVLIWLDMAIMAYLAWSYKSVLDENNPESWITELKQEKQAKSKAKTK